MAVDLHTHSRYSDGSDSPTEIIESARRIGLTAIALTDHDLLDGLEEAQQAAGSDIQLIPGAELSVEWEGKGMHLLTYWIDAGSPLADRLASIQQGRIARNHEMVEALVDLGVDITTEEQCTRREHLRRARSPTNVTRVVLWRDSTLVSRPTPTAFERSLRRVLCHRSVVPRRRWRPFGSPS